MNVQGTREAVASGQRSVASWEPGTENRPLTTGHCPQARRAFEAPRLTRHEPLTRITLVSGNDFGGAGGSGGTFFGG